MESSNKFLHKKLPDLQKSPEVQDSVDKHTHLTGEKVPNNPEARLGVYMERLEKIFLNEDETTRKRNIEMLRDKIYDAFIIKREDVPESYFELQQRVARERGQAVETIPQETKEQMIHVIIEDQKKSLDAWIDYLSSNDAMYPTWFKYFVFRNIAKLSQFDKELGKFKERTQSTTAPFPDIYREALAQVSDIYENASRDKELFKDKDFQTFLSKKFPTQYADKIQQTLEHSQESNEQIKGQWICYTQGDEQGAKKLYSSLQSKGTGWCTAGSSTAETQIKNGDFHVFYTYDKEGNPTQPRLAIRMNGTETIGEVRGVLPHQEVEPLLQETLDAKLSTFGTEADKYKKKSQNMKHLTAIDKAVQEGKTLNQNDLRFLYEVDGEIEGFGYQRDPRIEEIQGKRNRQEDIQTICNCEPQCIAHDSTLINENTKVFCEDTGKKITFVDFRLEANKKKIPQLLELAQKIKESGSPARPDIGMLGGIVDCAFDGAQVKDRETAFKSFEKADTTPPYIWPGWNNAKFETPEGNHFETIVLSYNKDPNTRNSSDKIVADMDKLGLRPLTLEEMTIVAITHPEFTKTSGKYFVGLTKYSLGGDSRVPSLRWIGDKRSLNWDGWRSGWSGGNRFLCARK
ncbi:MAG: hypothetical protein WCK60_01665 [Candidatus Nomurabacteria bacterium]